MELFEFVNGKVEIHPAAYTLKPFKKLLDRDKSKTKSKAIEELSFIYFFTDFKSDFNDILDDKKKIAEVKKVCISSEEWEPDELVLEAIKFYEKRQETTSSKLLQSTKHALAEIDNFYQNLDFEKVDLNGKPVFDVTKVISSLVNLGKTVQSLKDLEEIVRKEREETSRIRGGGEVGDYEE